MRLFARIEAGTLWRFAAGVIAVDAVLGLMVLLAPDPPHRVPVATEIRAPVETVVAIREPAPPVVPAAPVRTAPREIVVAIRDADPSPVPPSPAVPVPEPAPAALPATRPEPERPAPVAVAEATPPVAPPGPVVVAIANPDRRPPVLEGRRIAVPIRPPATPRPSFAGFRDGTGEPSAQPPAGDDAIGAARLQTRIAELPARPVPSRADGLIPVPVAIALAETAKPPASTVDALLPDAHVTLVDLAAAPVPLAPPRIDLAGSQRLALDDDARPDLPAARAETDAARGRAQALTAAPAPAVLAERPAPAASLADALLPESHVALADPLAGEAPTAAPTDLAGSDRLALDDEAGPERPAARAEAEAARGRAEALSATPVPVALVEPADPAASRADALLPAAHVVLADPLAAPTPAAAARADLVGSGRLAFEDELRRNALAARSLSDRLDPAGLPRPLRLAGDETRWTPPQGTAIDGARVELTPSMRPSPAVLLARWLPDRTVVAHSDPLKTGFVRQVLPLVMQVNDHILRLRDRAVTLAPEIEAGRILSPAEQRQVDEILEATRLERWDSREMLLRLDAVPLSMALAQAATESGWGTSRPAREDNALFGQMVFPPAAAPQVQAFRDLLETVAAYARNLNTHNAYAEFRRRRAALRERGRQLDGHALAAFIERYSERGVLYVEAIRDLMRANNLSALDVEAIEGALLQDAPPAAEPQGIDN